MSGGIENNVLVTKTSEQSKQYSRDPKKNLVQFLKVEEARVVVRSPHQNEKGRGAKEILLSDIYIGLKTFLVCA